MKVAPFCCDRLLARPIILTTSRSESTTSSSLTEYCRFSLILCDFVDPRHLLSLPSTMDEIAPEYDVVVLGTGKHTTPQWRGRWQSLTSTRSDGMCSLWVCAQGWELSCRISRADYGRRVLSVKGKKVLHIDRNDHYGGYAPKYRCVAITANSKQ